jgi:hypothetical protein
LCRRVEQRVAFGDGSSGGEARQYSERRLMAAVGEEVQKVVLARFLPQLARAILTQVR